MTHIANIRMENVRCGKAQKLYAIEGDPEDPVDGVVLDKVLADSVTEPSVLENARNVAIDGRRMKDVPATPSRKPHW